MSNVQKQRIAGKLPAQDQESDSKKKLSQNTKSLSQAEPEEKSNGAREKKGGQTKFDRRLARGRVVAVSRNGSHPYGKVRNQKEPQRIQKSVPKALPKQKPGIQAGDRALHKFANATKPTRGGNSLVQNMKIPEKKELSAERIQSRLKKKSPWFQSLMSPVDNAGVKIPDPIGTETAVYQHLENISVHINAQGMAGLRVLSPYINSADATDATDGVNYQITNDAADETSVLWAGSSGTVPGASSFRVTPGLMKANARSHRIVSACVVAQPEISTLDDSGEGTAFVTPLGANSGPPTYEIYQFQYDSTIAPVNVHKPLIARWYPIQGEAHAATPAAVGSEYENISYQDFVDPNDSSFVGVSNSVIPWEFGVLYTGLKGPGVVRFQICINYEFIPLAMSAMVVMSPSPVDEVEENLVSNWMSEAHVTEAIPPRQASVSQSASRVSEENEPTGLGMLFNVIEEVLPVAAKALPLLL